jgi:hypothetical protein
MSAMRSSCLSARRFLVVCVHALHAWCRSPRRPSFFACAKKEAKKHTPGGTPCASLRVRERPGNFRKAHPCAIRKRRPSGAAPFGFYPAHSPCLMGARRQEREQSHGARRSVRRGSWGPLRSGSHGGQNPQGGAQGCAPFSAGSGGPVRKFPPGLRTRRAAAGGPPGGVSFAYFSLHKQRKAGPPRRAAPCLNPQPFPSRLMSPIGSWARVDIALAAVVVESRDIRCVVFVAPHPNPSLPQGLPSVAAGRGASSAGLQAQVGQTGQVLFCGRIWHTAWHITSTRPASSRTSPARNN